MQLTAAATERGIRRPYTYIYLLVYYIMCIIVDLYKCFELHIHYILSDVYRTITIDPR